MLQRVKVPALKLDHLSSVPGTMRQKEKPNSYKLSSGFHVLWHMCAHANIIKEIAHSYHLITGWFTVHVTYTVYVMEVMASLSPLDILKFCIVIQQETWNFLFSTESQSLVYLSEDRLI